MLGSMCCPSLPALSIGPRLAWVWQHVASFANSQGCSSPLECQAQGAHVQQVFAQMRRPLETVPRPAVSYGCKVWAWACSLALGTELNDMLGVQSELQMAFFRQYCQLRKSVTPSILFREYGERSWLEGWWCFLLGFMSSLLLLPGGSLHLNILRDDIADARAPLPGPLPCANWARGVEMIFTTLGVASSSNSCGMLLTVMASWPTRLRAGDKPGMAF